MIGELDVAVADHGFRVDFVGDSAVIRFADYRTAKAVSGQPLPDLAPLAKALRFLEFGLKAKVGRRKPIELYPQPGFFVRWLVPAVNSLLVE